MNKFDKLKNNYIMEHHRIESFKKWPFDKKANCSIAKMAEAGFYWSGNERENDTVTCFVCAKTLDGWEATDDPWQEHAKHAPQCVFVKYGRREGNLTVEEFLTIFGIVVKNKILDTIVKKKKELLKAANKELDDFQKQQKI